MSVMQTGNFNPREFCSRKLLEVIDTNDQRQVTKHTVTAAVAELRARKDYLKELKDRGLI